jgi:hypothetical protein
MSLPPLVIGPLLLGLLGLLSAALGHRLFRIARIHVESGPVRWLVATGLGLGILQFLPFSLLAVGLGSPFGIKAGTLLLSLWLLPDLAAIARSIPRRAGSVARRWLGAEWWERTLAVAFAAILLAVFLRALCPITDDDGLSYHLAGAVRWLQAGRFTFLPTLTYTNWPSATEMLFVLLRGLHTAAPVGIVQFSYGAVTLCAVFLLGRRLGGAQTGWTAAVLMLTYKVFWEEMPQAHVDLGAALFATLSVFTLYLAYRDYNARMSALAAVFAGLGACCKLNGIWIVAAMAVVVAFSPALAQSSLRTRLRRAVVLFAVGITVVVPWLLRSWVITGNPVYPLFYGILGGREWTAEGWPRVQHYFFLMNTPPGLAPTPAVLLLSRAALVGIGALLAVVVYWRTRVSPLKVPARFAVTFIPLLFLSSGYNLRFLLPIYPCVVVCAGAGLGAFLYRSKRPGPAALCILAAVLGFRVAVSGLEPSLPVAASVAVGSTSSEQYLRAALPVYSATEFCNANVPANERILVGTWEESTAYYRSLALRPNAWLQDSVHYDSPERLDSDLDRLGVTHLVFKPMEVDWCSRSSVCNGRMTTETRALEALIRRRGIRVFEANGVAVYSLRRSLAKAR